MSEVENKPIEKKPIMIHKDGIHLFMSGGVVQGVSVSPGVIQALKKAGIYMDIMIIDQEEIEEKGHDHDKIMDLMDNFECENKWEGRHTTTMEVPDGDKWDGTIEIEGEE